MHRTTETLIASLDSRQEAMLAKIKTEISSMCLKIKVPEDKKLPAIAATSH